MSDRVLESDIGRVFDRMAEAWSRGDAAAYDSIFSDDVIVIDTAGTIVQGLADVSAVHRQELAGSLKGSTMKAELLSVRHLTPDAVLAVARNGMEPHGRTVIFSAALLKRDGHWVIISAQATVVRDTSAGVDRSTS